MDNFYLNTHTNVGNRQRAATFHNNYNPNLRPSSSKFMIMKYFDEQYKNQHHQHQHQQTNYANVDNPEVLPPLWPEPPTLMMPNNHARQVSRHSHHSRSHPFHAHSRTQSQHYYQTMHHAHHQFHAPANDPNYYYNLAAGPMHQPPITHSRHSPLNEPRMGNSHNFDAMTMLKMMHNHGTTIDSSPPMPAPRKYSIIQTGPPLDKVYFKVSYPQIRIMGKEFKDPKTRILLKPGDSILVRGPSEDRSLLTVDYGNHLLEIPHQYTEPPIPMNHR